MAYGFIPRGSMISSDDGAIQTYIIDDTKTISIGDAVLLSAGYADVSASSGANDIVGVCVGIVDASGIPVWQSGADIDGTLSNNITYVSASDNTSDKKCRVQVITSPWYLFYNEADSTIAQTEEGLFFDLASTGDRITGTGSATRCSMQLVKLFSLASGPNSYGEGLFRISESLFQNATHA